MLEMGILDALIVPKEYREQVYALDKGVCDRYLFSDVAHVRESLQEVLEVENGGNDILFIRIFPIFFLRLDLVIHMQSTEIPGLMPMGITASAFWKERSPGNIRRALSGCVQGKVPEGKDRRIDRTLRTAQSQC